MKMFHLFIVALTLVSCQNNRMEIESLQEESLALKMELRELKKSQQEFNFSAMVVEKDNSIQLGETYMADIKLSAFDPANPGKVVLCNVENEKLVPIGDTLNFNSYYESSLYKSTPSKIGMYKWGGIILQNVAGKIEEFPFIVSYEVKDANP